MSTSLATSSVASVRNTGLSAGGLRWRIGDARVARRALSGGDVAMGEEKRFQRRRAPEEVKPRKKVSKNIYRI